MVAAELRRAGHHDSGFSLIDMLVVVTLIGIVSGIAVPTLINSINAMRLGQSARQVEREMQMAKQRAVGTGRPMRVRFNCPATGEFRMVELIGSPSAPVTADDATTRCSTTLFPFPPDNDPITRPNLDGPVKILDEQVAFTAVQTIEFWPNGTAHYANGTGNPWPMIPTTGISITLGRMGKTSTVTVNGLGKIQIQ